MAWSDPKTWTADDLLTASDLNQYVSDNLSALYALVLGGGRKNLIQNGSMQVTQRGTSAAGKTTSDYYTADRWWAGINGVGTWTQSVEADAPTGSGFRNSLKMLITAGNEATVGAGDFVRVAQRLRGRDLQSIKKGTSSAEPLTVSFWVKSNRTGTYVVELYDVDNTRHVSATYTVEASGTWEEQAVTFPADLSGAFDNDANRSLDLVFWLAAGTDWTSGALDTTWASVTSEGASPGTTADNNRAAGQTNLAASVNNYWQLTGTQMETGGSSTGFEYKPYGEDLSECQEYYSPGAVPLGAVEAYAGSTTPTGWLLCYGQAVSRSTYSGLYSAIGTAYGTGDGSTTFNLPDLRGRTIAALDNMGGQEANRVPWQSQLGTVGTASKTTDSGKAAVALIESNLPPHSHSIAQHSHGQDAHSHNIMGAQTGSDVGQNSYGNWWAPRVDSVPWYGATLSSVAPTIHNGGPTSTGTGAGSSSEHNNMQPTMLLNYIIKAQGEVAADL